MISTTSRKGKISKESKVKNKVSAEVQITAEQLLLEAKKRELELTPPPDQKIIDQEEFKEYKLRKRKGFEDNIRKNRTVIRTWIRYAEWEESLKELQRARSIYERALDVDHQNVTLWLKYAEMEMKNRQFNHARNIWDRAITILPRVNQFWYKYTYMEEMLGNVAGCRQVFERWMEWEPEEQAWRSYINFERRYKEVEKARCIHDQLVIVHPEQKKYKVFNTIFEDHRGTEDSIINKRRLLYEGEIKANPHNYDAWFSYLKLVESDTNVDAVREMYERAIANVPLVTEKRHWRRYIYLWIYYALYEELEVEDLERTRQVYRACLDVIPHKKFTFAKIWLMYAKFEIRQKDLQTARQCLGTAIGKCPKNKLFRGYIELELQLREFDRCRKLYEKYLEYSPENCITWLKFTELEIILGEIERARAIYELAISQPGLHMPEVLWKSYIDFEIEQGESEKARGLYKRLLQCTQHVKEKEERLMLLEAWENFELEFGTSADKDRVKKLMPKQVKRKSKRKLTAEDGSDAGWEEYYIYIFPEDAANQPNLKLLAMAKRWKKTSEF